MIDSSDALSSRSETYLDGGQTSPENVRSNTAYHRLCALPCSSLWRMGHPRLNLENHLPLFRRVKIRESGVRRVQQTGDDRLIVLKCPVHFYLPRFLVNGSPNL